MLQEYPGICHWAGLSQSLGHCIAKAESRGNQPVCWQLDYHSDKVPLSLAFANYIMCSEICVFKGQMSSLGIS